MTRFFKTALALMAAGGGLIASGSAFAFPEPYCVRGYGSSVEPITLVDIDGIHNVTGATVGGTPADEDFTLTIGQLAPGGNYPISVQGNTDGNFQTVIGLYIDWDHSGVFDAPESYLVGAITNSTGVDGKTASTIIPVPAGAALGQTRMRVVKQFSSTTPVTIALAPACGTTGFGQAEDYTVNVDPAAAIPPTLTKAFSPTNAAAGADSTLTLTFGNTNPTPATLTAALTDTFPTGLLVAATPNASTTCSGTLTATAGASSINLASGGAIPTGGCTISVSVNAASAGIFVNTIAGGSLQTDKGSAGTASATYQATTAGVTTYSTGFETPTFVVGQLGTQGGWGRSGGAAADLTIATINPGAGTQHLRSTWAAAGTGTVAAISGIQPVGTTTYTIASAKLAINQNAAANGTEWDFTPQDPGAGFVTTRVRFLRPTAGVNKIQVLDPNGGGPGVAAYVDTGAFWTAGAYFDVKVIANRAAQTSQICINGASIFTVNGFAKNIGNLAITGTKGTGTNGNTLDVDNVVIDNTNIGTCNGLPPPHTVTPSVGTASGTITPSTPQTVADGATTAFTLAPAAGFHIVATTGTCGGALAGNVFTTNAVTADCTVIANFAADIVTHVVTPSVGTASGTISPSTPQTVNDGSTTAFTLAPAAGFHIVATTGTCGGTLAGNVFTTAAVIADCTVIANFAADTVTHVVTPSVGTASGTISPSTPQTVNDGSTTAFTLAPAVGFHIVATTGTCGGTLAGNVFTTAAVIADCTVIANFAADVTPGTFPPDENFDEVTAPALPGGWVSAHSGAGIDWVTSTTASDTAPNSAYAAEFPAVADETLTSPTFTAVAGQILTFRHSYNLEVSTTAPTTYDGAVLEISINGGAFQDIITAGGSFVSGGYNKVVSATFSNPLASRPAWGGNSGGFVTTVVGLPAAAVGQPAQLRFRTGDDNSAVAAAPNGWSIDTLHLGVSNAPSATVTPASLSFTAATNGTDAHTLTIANAAGSSPLTYSIATHGTGPRPVLRPHVQAVSRANRSGTLSAKDLYEQDHAQHASAAGIAFSTGARVASPWAPNGSIVFQLDDGTADGGVGWGTNGPPASESGAVWINRFTATGALTVDSISVLWKTPTTGSYIGLQPNLVVYYDAASTGDPTNATRVGTDTLVTIATQDAYETYPTNFSIPGAGDVYIGFVDQWAIAGGFTPRLFPGTQDRTVSAHSSWLSGNSSPPTDIDNLINNSTTGVIDDLSAALAGNWMIRATGTAGGGGGPCTGPAVPWLTAAPSSGSVNGGASATVTVTADPAAGSLAVGSYTAEVCITTNDPVNALISVPVTLTVTEAPFVACSGGADEIFCDGFEGTGGGTAGTYTDRTTFLTHVAAGFFENAFNDVVASTVPEAAMSYSDVGSGIAYTIDTLPVADDLWNGTGIISTNGSGDQLTVTFTGAPVTAVGGNFFASDVDVLPIVGNQVVITLSDGTTETFNTAGDTDFRGFTTLLPIASITIDAPNPLPDGSWATMDNLIVGSGN